MKRCSPIRSGLITVIRGAETTFVAGARDAKPARFIRAKKAQITLSISPELLDQVDEIARRKHLSRAGLATAW
jgi:hypothetical protein